MHFVDHQQNVAYDFVTADEAEAQQYQQIKMLQTRLQVNQLATKQKSYQFQ